MLNLTSCKPDFIASIEYFRVNLNLFFCWFVVIPCFPVPGKWSQARKPNTLWGMLGLLYKQKDRCVYCDCITLITTITAVRKLLLSVFITAVDSAVVEERNNGWLSLSWLACLPEMKAHRARLINTQLELVHLSLYGIYYLHSRMILKDATGKTGKITMYCFIGSLFPFLFFLLVMRMIVGSRRRNTFSSWPIYYNCQLEKLSPSSKKKK